MRTKLLIPLLAGALALVGCGGDDDTTAPSGDPASTADAPERIVSLSPSATEMLFAIGAGERVVAVDDQSNHPPEAPITDLSGYQPNIEAIVGYDPDLVVTDNAALEADLAKVGVDVLVLPAAATIDDVYDQIERLGKAVGTYDSAATLVAQMQADVDEILATVPEGEPLTFYHELDDTYYSVTSKTFIGQVYESAGLVNVADAADTDGSGYPQLSAEYILDTDPDIVFLADTKCCGQSAETVAQRPGWAGLRAVQRGAVIELDDDVASRWGPRVVDFLRVVVDAVTQLRAG